MNNHIKNEIIAKFFFQKRLLYYETVFFYRGDRRSQNLRVHTLIQSLLKEHVLLLSLAKYGEARAPCAPPIPPLQKEPTQLVRPNEPEEPQFGPTQLAMWIVLYLHIPV